MKNRSRKNPKAETKSETRITASTEPWPISVETRLNSIAARVAHLEAQLERPEALFRGSGISPASIRGRLEQCEARIGEVEAGHSALVAQLLSKEG